MTRLAPNHIRYIKLGAGGRWESAALDGGRIEWGVVTDPHELSLSGNWEAVRKHYTDLGMLPATATGYANEARHFYEAEEDTLWVTFARGRMWWTVAGPEVIWTGGDETLHGTRHRIAVGGWRDTDIEGNALTLDRLTTRLTKLAGYRRTTCALNDELQRLCLRYINAEPDEAQAAVVAAKAELRRTLLTLIQRLSWDDFEALADLMLVRGGWTRVGALGGLQKDVDLIVEQPITGERLAVQIKSSATQSVVNDYATRLSQRSGDERLMLICHSPEGSLRAPPAADGRLLELMLGEAVADRVMRAGLIDWVMQRAA